MAIVQSVSVKQQHICKDKREQIALVYALAAAQQDIANLWAALNSITLQLDTNSVAGHPYNPVNSGPAINLPSAFNDQLLAYPPATYPLNLQP